MLRRFEQVSVSVLEGFVTITGLHLRTAIAHRWLSLWKFYRNSNICKNVYPKHRDRNQWLLSLACIPLQLSSKVYLHPPRSWAGPECLIWRKHNPTPPHTVISWWHWAGREEPRTMWPVGGGSWQYFSVSSHSSDSFLEMSWKLPTSKIFSYKTILIVSRSWVECDSQENLIKV